MTPVYVYLAILAVIAAVFVAILPNYEIRRKDTEERDEWEKFKEANKI